MDDEEKLLVRLDERVSHLSDRIVKMERVLTDELETLSGRLREYLTKSEFWPWKALLSGLVGLMLGALILALVNKVIH